ncbi:HD domain-containing protein [[Eubacterium] hominis]|uniref:HD domain-containing protein n=1 Tax=[Eubacterium] hominis TaxID=2764325 RepID=UPI003A4E1B71
MDRLEMIRMKVDKIISKLANEETRKFAYLHSYGVSQCAIYLSIVRGLDIELAGIAGMLHDIAVYAENCAHKVHANRSAVIAKDILEESKAFNEEEIIAITNAIALHSDKLTRTDTRFAEMLKDADVLQHYLYNPNMPMQDREKYRLFYLLEDLKKLHQRHEQTT